MSPFWHFFLKIPDYKLRKFVIRKIIVNYFIRISNYNNLSDNKFTQYVVYVLTYFDM